MMCIKFWQEKDHVPKMAPILHQLLDGLSHLNPTTQCFIGIPTVTLPGAEFRNHPHLC
jgi:hypothetical protein